MPKNSTLNESAVNMASDRAPTETAAKSPLLEKIRAWRHRLPFVARLALAIPLLMLGILGGFIPILQGWVFVLAAFWLLFPNQAEQLIEKIKTRLAKLRKKS